MSQSSEETPGPSQFNALWRLVALVTGLSLVCGCAGPSAGRAPAPVALRFAESESQAQPGPPGPTLRLHNSSGQDLPVIPIADFMYFVPLISPEPLSMTLGAGNTQRVRLGATRRSVAADSFSVEYEFEIGGDGVLLNTFDHAPLLQRNEKKLRDGGVQERALDTITIGAGLGIIEIEGAISNGLASVTEVRLRFNARGRPSPVSIGTVDLRVTNGAARASNEHVARVNALTFRRGSDGPRMGVTLASVRRKDGGEGLWSRLTAMAANLVLKPMRVEGAGHEAMLNFGRHLAAEAPFFTFPRAKNLKAASGAQPLH